MATITNTVKWVDNTAELKASILSGTDSIVAMKSQVDRTVDSMGGSGLFGAANKLVAAIDQLGGITKLTAAEQDRANATLDKAIDKYTAMGMTAPPAMVELRDKIVEARTESDGFGDSAGKLGDILKQAFTDPMGALASLGGMLEGSLGAIGIIGGIVVAAITGIVAGIVSLGEHGAEVNDVATGFRNFSGGADQANATLQAMRQGVQGTVSDFALQTDALHLMSAGVKLTTNDYSTLTQASLVLAHEGFGTTKDVLDQLTQSLITGRTRTIERMTGVIDATEGEGQYAGALGVSTSELSKAGIAEAKRLEIMQRLQQVVEQAGPQELSFKDRIDQMKTSMTNANDALSVAVATSPVLATALKFVGDGLMNAFGANQVQTIQTIIGWVNTFAVDLTYVVQAALVVAQAFNMGWSAIKTTILGVETVIVGLVDGVYRVLALATEGAAKFNLVSPEQLAGVRDMRTQLDGMTVSLAQQTAEAAKGVIGQNSFGQSIEGAFNATATLRGEMEAASNTQVDATKIINALGAAHDVNTAKMDAAAKKYLATWESTETELEKLWNREAAADASASSQSLAVRLANLQKQEQDEDAVWAEKLAKGTATQTQYDQAIYSIHQYYTDQGAKLTQDEADKETAAHQKAEDDIQKIRDAGFAAEVQTGVQGLDAQLANLDKQKLAEEAAWQQKIDTGQVRMDEYGEAIVAIEDKYGALETAKSVTWEQQKWKAIGDIENQAYALEQQLAGDSEQAKLAANDRELKAKLATLTAEQKLDQDYVDALTRLYADKAAAIAASYDPLVQAWRTVNTDMRNEWAKTWDAALNGTTSFVNALLSPFTDIANSFKKLLAGMLADWESQLLKPMLDSMKSSLGNMGSAMGGLLSGGSSYGGGGAGDQGPTIAQAGGDAAAGGISTAIMGGLVTGGIGIAASLIPTMVSWIKSIGGPSAEELQGRQTEGQFEQGLANSLSATEKLQAGTSQLTQSVYGLADQYIALGMTSDQAFTQANTDMAAVMAAEKSGGAAVQQVITQIQARQDALKASQAAVATSVNNVTSAWKAAGTFIPEDIQNSVKALLQMNGLTDAQKTSLQGLLDSAQPGFQGLQQDASALGLDISKLGPTLAQQNLDGKAEDLFGKFTQLQQGGADFNALLGGTADKFNAIVSEALTTGTKVPENLQPILQTMANNGILVDQNGNKLTDLSKISFEDTPLSSSLQSLQQTIQELVDTLNKVPGAANAAASAAAGVGAGGGAGAGAGNPAGGYTGGLITNHGIQHFDTGVAAGKVLPFPFLSPPNAVDTTPIWAQPGEVILNAAQQGNLARTLGGRGGSTVDLSEMKAHYDRLEARLEAMQRQTEAMHRQQMTLPGTIARATRDAALIAAA